MITVELETPRVEGLADEAWEIMRLRLLEYANIAGFTLANAFKRTVGGPGTGRPYRRTKSGKMHRASAPGQPPARDFGKYVQSFIWGVSEKKDEVIAMVGSTMWRTRGKLLEFGTRRMAPRPHVDQALNAARPEIERELGAL